jgi:hypothetical protein
VRSRSRSAKPVDRSIFGWGAWLQIGPYPGMYTNYPVVARHTGTVYIVSTAVPQYSCKFRYLGMY